MATDPSEFVSIFSPGGTRLTLPPASPAGSEAGGVGSAQSSQTPAQQGAAGSVVQKILGGPSGSIGSVGGGSDTAGSKTGATEPVTPAPVSPARIGDGPGEQRTGAQSPPVMMSPEMLKTILAESMAMGMQIAGASAEKQEASKRANHHGSAKQAPSPLFCSVLACSGAPAEQTRFVLLCHPATPRWSRRAGGTAGPRLGKEAGAAWGPPPIARASRVGGGLWGGGSSKNQRSLRQNLLCWRSEPRDLRAQCTVSAQTALTHFIVPSQAGPTDLVRA